MKRTQQRFREIQEALHKRFNADPQKINESEEFFSKPQIVIGTKIQKLTDRIESNNNEFTK